MIVIGLNKAPYKLDVELMVSKFFLKAWGIVRSIILEEVAHDSTQWVYPNLYTMALRNHFAKMYFTAFSRSMFQLVYFITDTTPDAGKVLDARMTPVLSENQISAVLNEVSKTVVRTQVYNQ